MTQYFFHWEYLDSRRKQPYQVRSEVVGYHFAYRQTHTNAATLKERASITFTVLDVKSVCFQLILKGRN